MTQEIKRVEEETRYFERFKRWEMIVIFLVLALVLTLSLSIAVGQMQISLPNTWKIVIKNIPFFGDLITEEFSVLEEVTIMQVRLPRTIAAMIVGIALSVAGVVLQGLFRNPMAEPYLLGISSGAALGAAIVIGLGIGSSFLGIFDSVQLMAFIGALVSVFVVYNIAKMGPRVPMLTVLLAGIAMTSFLSAVISFIMITLGESLHSLIFWLFGTLSGIKWSEVTISLPLITLGIFVILIFSRQLNIMLLGQDEAQQLGIETERLKKIMLVFATLITATAVAISGTIGFIGLVIPHIARILVGPDHRILIPSSALAGAIILVFCDTLSRIVIQPAELPVGVLTAFFGAPFFLYLLRKKKGLGMKG
ncbi:MAG: iron chelate uptake ABC transporter family permease subunit [Candidatus Methylarchaceae archaeon HK02M2]|nr:iron chelate uptake ABC transporter family permease subunit [Candidatus Methylarchaceae archaeon HK02M2]